MSGINAIGTDYSWLFNTKNQKQDSVSKLWSSYSNYKSNAASTLSGLTEINTNLKSVLSSYTEAKNTFNVEFEENMSALSESSKEVARYSFSVPKDGAITKTETTDENGIVSTKTTYSKDLQSALDVVNDFVSNYNSSLKFLNDNASVSKRVANLAATFSDTTYFASNYGSIGLTVSSDGSLEVNEEQLAQKIIDNPDRVSSVLGGLTSRTEAHISFANAQQDNLFPSAQSMLGDQISAASLYTGKAYLNMSTYATMGNLLDIMF